MPDLLFAWSAISQLEHLTIAIPKLIHLPSSRQFPAMAHLKSLELRMAHIPSNPLIGLPKLENLTLITHDISNILFLLAEFPSLQSLTIMIAAPDMDLIEIYDPYFEPSALVMGMPESLKDVTLVPCAEKIQTAIWHRYPQLQTLRINNQILQRDKKESVMIKEGSNQVTQPSESSGTSVFSPLTSFFSRLFGR